MFRVHAIMPIGAVIIVGLLLSGCPKSKASNQFRPMPSNAPINTSLNFIRAYKAGKRLYRQKLYLKSAHMLQRAAYLTKRGKQHFGAHYYLARVLFRLAEMRLALEALEKAATLIRTKPQKQAYARAKHYFHKLYNKVTFASAFTPGSLQQLQLILKPKTDFSHRTKRHHVHILQKRLKANKGFSLSQKSLYLPKGEYTISIRRPQCLALGLFRGSTPIKELSTKSKPLIVQVKRKRSCRCLGGKKIVKTPKGLSCACPRGTVWFKRKGYCAVIYYD